MAVVRPSTRPLGPSQPPERAREQAPEQSVEQGRHRLVPVPLSHQQAPPRVEPETTSPSLSPAQALRPISPQGFRPQETSPPPLPPEPPIPVREPEAPSTPARWGEPPPVPTRPPDVPTEPPLSPELALVSPELAEEARRAEPEPPEWSWDEEPEQPEPPRQPPRRRPPTPPASERRPRIEPPGPARRPAPPPSREPRYVPGEKKPPRARRRPEVQRPRIRTSTFVLMGLAAFVAVTGVLPARDAPTVVSPPPTGKATRPKAPRQAPSPLVAGAVYAEGDRLRLRVGENGRRLTGTTGTVPCAPGGVSFQARVARDGSFRGTLHGQRTSATGTVLGRFGPRTTASGILRVRRPACDSGPVLFVAGIPRG